MQKYTDELPRLRARESLEAIMEVGVGTGSVKNGRGIHSRLRRQARRKTEAVRAGPTELAGLGIGYQKWQKN